MPAKLAIRSPFPEENLGLLWAWIEQVRDRIVDDFAPQTFTEFLDDWDRQSAGRITCELSRDGAPCGGVVFAPANPYCATMTIVMRRNTLRPEESQELISRAVQTAGFGKIVATLFSDNLSMVALLRKTGFEVEGTMRAHTLRGGKPIDVMILGLRGER